MVGLDKLTNSFGLLSLFRGAAAIIGPPFAGAYLVFTMLLKKVFFFLLAISFVLFFPSYAVLVDGILS